ncbi:MAG: UvrD-helicase domain-containing protein [Bacilli bacterium]|nr:MAG: UvrD-helicase domain-containing protein [Bacilli bacterium]
MANLAIKLVKENSQIREEIKNNLNEILIDEYQDTNDVQEEFISYISNNNVYMVGDIKQSIYRFRNANPYIFKNKYDMYSSHNNGMKIDLNKNFRSREEVINNINLMFNHIMDDYLGGASYQKEHQMIYGNLMYQGNGDNKENNNFEIYNYLNDTNYKKTMRSRPFVIADDINNKNKG